MPSYTIIISPEGRLPEGIKATLANVFRSFASKKIRLTIAEAKEKRSLDQNAYYWAAIVPHVRQVRFEAGDPVTEDQCHEDLLYEYAPRVKGDTLHGEVYSRPMRSKEMDVAQMAEYITAITAAMAAFGSPVPIMGEY